MDQKLLKLQIYRCNLDKDAQPYLQTYEIPCVEGMSIMQALDHIYEHIDSSLAYYSHSACTQGMCGQCTAMINGKAGLLCQTLVEDGMILSAPDKKKIIKDLVYQRGG